MTASSNHPPRISPLLLGWFSLYVNRFLRLNFHGLHLLQLASLETLKDKPLLVCMNHPSWWDALIILYVSRNLFRNRAHYGPILGKAIARYKFFARLGAFGIDPATRAGAATFLSIGTKVLNDPNAALWVTPQGSFCDVRLRPVQFEMGVGHLARRAAPFMMLPIAVEYAFWDERYPEAFVCLGEPLLVKDGPSRPASAWAACFAERLQTTQDALASKVIARNKEAFEPLMTGRAGVGGIYDSWRSWRARLQGKKFDPEHGNL